jgi:hypothetical protein
VVGDLCQFIGKDEPENISKTWRTQIMNANRNAQKWIPLIALTVLLLASLACGGNTSPTLVATTAPVDPALQEQPTQVPPVVSPQNYKVGDIVSISDSVLTVLGWENVPGNDFSKPDAGNKFVAVELLIVNNSQSAMSVSTLMQMSLKDNTGQKYDVDFLASTATNAGSVDGELAPGEKVRGEVGFQIPETAQGLQFVFDDSIFGTGKVFFDLGAEPLKLEPPVSIAGESSQQSYNIGDVVAMGTTTITVNQVTNPAGDQFNQPDPGNKFLVIDLTIQNQSATAISFSSLLQTWLKDASAQKYDVDLMASVASGNSSPDGEIAPGETVRGQICFQVPATATGLTFVFDADVWGTGKAFVALP